MQRPVKFPGNPIRPFLSRLPGGYSHGFLNPESLLKTMALNRPGAQTFSEDRVGRRIAQSQGRAAVRFGS
jgi:hypothetical protein